jgi:hypothetical protein
MAKKSKLNFKELLMKKGEKLGLIVAIGVFILFVLLGVTSVGGAVKPAEQQKKIESATAFVEQAIKNPDTKTAPLPGELLKPVNFTQVSADAFPNHVATFEPTQRPSTLRDNPLVKSPIEAQVNYFAGSYKGYDRRFDVVDGELQVRVGVLKVKTKQDFDWGTMEDRLTKPQKKGPLPKGPPAVAPVPMTQLVPPGLPRPGESPPPPGMMGKPNTHGDRDDLVVDMMTWEQAMKSKLPPARTIYPLRFAVIQASFPLKEQLLENMRSLRLPNLAAAQFESSQATIDARVPVRPGVPGAPAVIPVAPPMAVAPAGVPAGPGAAPITVTGDSPAFVGPLTGNGSEREPSLVVERRVTGPDGQPSGWESFNHQEKFFEKFTRYETPFVQEDGYLPYFLRPYQGLSSPLPVMAGGFLQNYPPNVSLKSIYENYQRLLAEKFEKKPASSLDGKFKRGDGNPYAPAGNATGNQPGGFGGEETRPPAFTLPPGARPGAGPEGNPAVPGGATDPNKLDVEYILLRFLDTDLIPGHSYEYRMKVRMKNPNFNNPTKVANESMANEEILESQWYEVGHKVTVPVESFLYAYSAKKYEEEAKKLYEECGKPDVLNQVLEVKDVMEGRKVVVQMQRWQEYQSFGAKQEPIGAFIQAQMPVGPGEYIGRRTLVELPLWRSGVMDPKATKDTLDPYSGAYVLPSADAKTPMIAKWPTDNGTRKYTLPRARIIDFRTPHVLIDFDGGHVTTTVKTGTGNNVSSTTQNDEAAADLLILRDDGKIEIRRESIDMANTNPLTPRAQREKTWEEWLARVRKSNDAETPGATPGTGLAPPRGGLPPPR